MSNTGMEHEPHRRLLPITALQGQPRAALRSAEPPPAPVLRVEFRLPLPPSINQQYATVNGRRVLSKESRNYKRRVVKRIQSMRQSGLIPDTFVDQARTGYLALFIDFYFETPLRRDLDGGLKIAQDAICTGLDVDDRRVVDIHLVKRTDRDRPRIEVELEALPDWPFGRASQALRKTEDPTTSPDLGNHKQGQ